MNVFHVTILLTTVCFCYGIGVFQPHSVTSSPYTCPATTVTPEIYTEVFAGKIMFMYNISALGPNVLNCFFFDFKSLPDKTSDTTNAYVSYEINGKYIQRHAVVVLSNGPAQDIYTDNGERRLYSGTKNQNGVIVLIDCLDTAVVYLVGCNLSNCGSAVQQSVKNTAAQLASSLNLNPLSSFAVSFKGCANRL